MKKREIIVLSLLIISLITVSLYQTLATDITMNKTNSTDADLSYTFDITDQTGRVVNVKAGATKVLDIFVINSNSGTIKYGIAYTPSTVKTNDIIIAQLNTSKDSISGLINKNEKKQITIVIVNNSTSNITLSLVAVTGYEHGGDLIVPDNHTLITEEYEIEEPTGANTITEIFTSADKTVVINNDIEYQYAPSVGMMEDVGGNIRYYGADPNNYVSFNNELWRIIGVFKDIDDGTGKTEIRLKIARSESIGDYQWDDNENEWSTATLNAYLNGIYLNSLTSEAQTMIGDAKWNLGGWDTSSLYANQFYEYERGTTVLSGRSTEWTGKIALMYPSDYMYAGDLSKCSKDGYNWDTDQTNCRDTSWLRNTSNIQWTITPFSSVSHSVFYVYNSGYVDYHNGVTNFLAYRPILYLSSTVQITGGDGTSGNPFTLG